MTKSRACCLEIHRTAHLFSKRLLLWKKGKCSWASVIEAERALLAAHAKCARHEDEANEQ